MIDNLIRWALGSRLVVILLALALTVFGVHAFRRINVEAYPDPAPAIVELVARYPGASAEEVERLVTIPLEVALAGMPGLQYTRSQSLFELCHIRNQFEYGVDSNVARQEVLNRLRSADLKKPDKDKIMGLECGADYFVQKSENPAELLATLRADPGAPLGCEVLGTNVTWAVGTTAPPEGTAGNMGVPGGRLPCGARVG